MFQRPASWYLSTTMPGEIFVLRQNISVAPHVILETDGVILEKPHLHVPVKDSFLALDVFEIQGGIEVDDFKQSLRSVAPDELPEFDESAEQCLPITKEQTEQIREEGDRRLFAIIACGHTLTVAQ